MVTKSGRLGSRGERRGPRRDEVRRKLEEVGTLVWLTVNGVVGLFCVSSAVVSELDMKTDGDVDWSRLLSGSVMGEQSSSS